MFEIIKKKEANEAHPYNIMFKGKLLSSSGYLWKGSILYDDGDDLDAAEVLALKVADLPDRLEVKIYETPLYKEFTLSVFMKINGGVHIRVYSVNDEFEKSLWNHAPFYKTIAKLSVKSGFTSKLFSDEAGMTLERDYTAAGNDKLKTIYRKLRRDMASLYLATHKELLKKAERAYR